MNSFVLSEWLLLKWDKGADITNYRQLYLLLRNAITEGEITPGIKLPSTRSLAADLGISRNTVLESYEQLIDEGYIYTKYGSGTYVQNINQEIINHLPSYQTTKPDEAAKTSEKLISDRGSSLMENIGFSNYQEGAFVPGIPDIREFPIKKWLIIQNRAWKNQYSKLLSYAPSGGYMPLRSSISDYVSKSRYVRCNNKQVILTTGIYQGIDITARILCDPGDLVWIEEPSYSGLRNLLLASGLRLLPIPVDKEGLTLNNIKNNEKPKLIVVSPSHQYPLGMTMSLARRRALLEYARISSCWILEDDYDSEFRYENRPLPSLQGMDTSGRVIYVSSFSKTLAPGLRVGFLIVPEVLSKIFSDAVSELHREGNMMKHSILAEFIKNGHLGIHIRHMRKIYSKRRKHLINLINKNLDSRLKILGSDTGLHLVIKLPKDIDDFQIAYEAIDKGVITRPLSMYYYDKNNSNPGLVLGYGGANINEINSAFKILQAVLKKHL